MDEQLKDRILIAMAILTVICLILAISSSIAAQKYKKSLQKEMVLRLDAEEKLTNRKADYSTLEGKLQHTQSILDGMDKSRTDLEAANIELREELKRMTHLKEILEDNLKEALTESKR